MWTGSNSNPNDLEPYTQSTEYNSISITQADESTIAVELAWVRHDNADMNTVGEAGLKSVEGITGDIKITFTLVEGNWKISNAEDI